MCKNRRFFVTFISVYSLQCKSEPLVFDPFTLEIQSGVIVNATSYTNYRPIEMAAINQSSDSGYWLPDVNDFDPNVTVSKSLINYKIYHLGL